MPVSPTSAGPLVLVVEDDPGTCALLHDLLTDDGYTPLCLDSALGVQDVVRQWHPVAILLDLALPYRSRAAVLADLKADPATATIPVIVVSAHPDALPHPRAALASAIIAKPFAPAVLLEALRAA
jgi:CheY-like chemotaxis protein